jgi:hypothetical protein
MILFCLCGAYESEINTQFRKYRCINIDIFSYNICAISSLIGRFAQQGNPYAIVWRPRFLISIINANGRIGQVKLADVGQT